MLRKTLWNRFMYAERAWPSLMKLTTDYGSERTDYCILFFNHAAYEFYHLLFLLGKKDDVVFENIPDPKINTVPSLLKWARSFEAMKKRQYQNKGFTWEPVSEQVAELQVPM